MANTESSKTLRQRLSSASETALAAVALPSPSCYERPLSPCGHQTYPARPPPTPCPDSVALGSGTPPPDFAAVLGLRHRPPPPATASSGGTGGADDASSDGAGGAEAASFDGAGDTGFGGAGSGGGHGAGEDEVKRPRRASP
ncbi:uncharacterized protein [Miscanthus floridulus]|uniref:uncharacterized protein n=1 Tax=Miscanthus floridulus TaxID=154761 RepID=UPI0034574DDF